MSGTESIGSRTLNATQLFVYKVSLRHRSSSLSTLYFNRLHVIGKLAICCGGFHLQH